MAKKGLKKGIFITFEGVEGCGKTTHSKLLFEHLKKSGYPCVYTREPGGTELGEKIRKVLLSSDSIRISDLVELFLFEACRCEIVKEIIAPALAKKKIVICDRFSDATVCYQGYGGGIDLNIIKKLDNVATNSLIPDLTILLNIDTLEGLRRAREKGIDRMEAKARDYHERVRRGYLKIAKNNPRRIKIIDMDGSVDKVQPAVRKEVERVVQRYKRTG